jgi:hypothetical protein
MDNTDVKQPVILTKTFTNRKTGQVMSLTQPDKPVYKRKRKTIAAGKGRKTVGRVLVSRLVPFRFAMALMLQRKGIDTSSMPFKTVIALYYNNFCLTDASKKPIDVFSFGNNLAFKLSTETDTNGQSEEARNLTAFTEIAEIVNHIIYCFREAKERYLIAKEQGLNPKYALSDEQFTQAKACMLVEKDLLMKEQSDNYIKVGSVLSVVKWLLVFALAYYFIKQL